MSITPESLQDAVDTIMPEVIDIRRHLHQHPELSGKEKNTSLFLASKCRELGLAVRDNIGGFGLRVDMNANQQHWLALRADMDALPIHDAKVCDYTSTHQGVVHACGHDAHSAMLWGAIKILHQFKPHLAANIACVFQPAEETCQGASAMLQDHLFADISPQQIFSLHVYPSLPSGSIGLKDGAMCAATDIFDVEITGDGGHAARPHECIDVILVSSHIIQALHHIVSRKINPLHTAVLTIGSIQGGSAANVIPETVSFSGTLRSLNIKTHDEMRRCMTYIIHQTAKTWGATARFKIRHATPALINHPSAMSHVRNAMSHWLPEISTVELNEPSMGGEDFAEYLQTIPGCLLRLGTGKGPSTHHPLHHPKFDIDETAMRSGILTMVSVCLS